MDNIFLTCRRGDFSKVKYLVEEKEINLNVRDCWDSTPLYYACLCGHYDIVKYLLENGARCDKDTFDGERCLYGSLTNEIKKLLLDAKVITAQTKRRDDYDNFCESLLRAEDLSDITFLLEDNNVFKLHKCILSTRSEHFRSLFQTRWKDRSEIRNSIISTQVFRDFLTYVYTGRTICQRDALDQLFRLADQCQMPQLKAALEAAVLKAESFEGSKKGVHVSTISVENDIFELQQAFGFLLEQGLPSEFSSWPAANALPLMRTQTYFDMCLRVESEDNKFYHFYCHKLFLRVRSGYFDAMLQNHFDEAQLEDNIPILTLYDVTPEVLTCVLYYVYTNNPQLNDDVVLYVLRCADMYLLQGLKRECGAFLANKIDSLSTNDQRNYRSEGGDKFAYVLMLFKLARLYDLPRLENRCTEFMAANIDNFLYNEEFQGIVISDASEVQAREDTDSIQLIDDIRYHITSGVQTFSEVEDANDKLQQIDKMLETLGLEA